MNLATAPVPRTIGRFRLRGIAYLVTDSAGPRTLNVYETATALMVCSVIDPLGIAIPLWGHQWSAATAVWQRALLDHVAQALADWRTACRRPAAGGRS